MATSLSALDPMTGDRAGGCFLDSKTIGSFAPDLSRLRDPMQAAYHSIAPRQDSQAQVDMSQESQQRWSYATSYFHDASTPQSFQNLPVPERSDFRYDHLQGSGEEKRSFGASVNSTSRHEYQQTVGTSLLNNDQQRVLLTFPEGEADAVTITERDLEGLHATEYVGNNIIDFYIKYLERRLSSEDRERLYFFNSFFFTKLLGSASASNDIDQCKVDYEQVRKWLGKVNLFEKEYIFIPVLRRNHWSLIIICHLSSLWSSPDTRKGSPCILHLDPIEGMHENFKRQVRSYLSKAWMEKYGAPCDTDQLLDICQMEYVQAEVPRQDNHYDCGLYLLQYVEVFLLQLGSPNFRFAARKESPLLGTVDFAQVVSAKRKAIQELIFGLSQTSQEQSVKSMNAGNLSRELRTWSDGKAISGGCIGDVPRSSVSMFNGQGDESKHPSSGVIAEDNDHQIHCTGTGHTEGPTWESGVDTNLPLNGVQIEHAEYQSADEVAMDKNQQSKEQPCAALCKPLEATKNRKWTQEETWILLKCKVEGGDFCKENRVATRWDIISQEIKNKAGTMPTGYQCRLRYDTLLKAYKTIQKFREKTGKSFSEITGTDRLELKLATTLSEEWYEAIVEICRLSPQKPRSQKRLKVGPGDDNGLVLPSLSHPPAPAYAPTPAGIPAQITAAAPLLTGSSKVEITPQRQVVSTGLVSLISCNPAPLSPIASPCAATPARVPDPFTAPAVTPFGSSKLEKTPRRRVVTYVNDELLRTLETRLRHTLVNLIQFSLMKLCLGWWSFGRKCDLEVEVACQWLAIVQDQKPSDIRKFIYKLSELKLVKLRFGGSTHNEAARLGLSNLRVQEKFLKEVLCMNPDFDIYLEVCQNLYSSRSFPDALHTVPLQRIRVLSLHKCKVIECADLSDFPELRSLHIRECGKLRAITGWEVVKELGWLEICHCRSYVDFPPVQCLPSLREFRLQYNGDTLRPRITRVPDFSNCDRLRTLEIARHEFSALNNIMDLSTLRFLEVLQFRSDLTTIEGLSGLHSLRKLVLENCRALREVPDLGRLKALTHLDLSWSGVEEIAGVQELHLLTDLDLWDCCSLKTLPWLGHLKVLAHLDIGGSGVEEIPGVEDLVSLERLHCWGSRLERLPDLHHLRRLRWVHVGNTPLSTTDPSSFYYGKGFIKYNSQEGRQGFGNIEISDVSDLEQTH